MVTARSATIPGPLWSVGRTPVGAGGHGDGRCNVDVAPTFDGVPDARRFRCGACVATSAASPSRQRPIGHALDMSRPVTVTGEMAGVSGRRAQGRGDTLPAFDPSYVGDFPDGSRSISGARPGVLDRVCAMGGARPSAAAVRPEAPRHAPRLPVTPGRGAVAFGDARRDARLPAGKCRRGPDPGVCAHPAVWRGARGCRTTPRSSVGRRWARFPGRPVGQGGPRPRRARPATSLTAWLWVSEDRMRHRACHSPSCRRPAGRLATLHAALGPVMAGLGWVAALRDKPGDHPAEHRVAKGPSATCPGKLPAVLGARRGRGRTMVGPGMARVRAAGRSSAPPPGPPTRGVGLPRGAALRAPVTRSLSARDARMPAHRATDSGRGAAREIRRARQSPSGIVSRGAHGRWRASVIVAPPPRWRATRRCACLPGRSRPVASGVAGIPVSAVPREATVPVRATLLPGVTGSLSGADRQRDTP